MRKYVPFQLYIHTIPWFQEIIRIHIPWFQEIIRIHQMDPLILWIVLRDKWGEHALGEGWSLGGSTGEVFIGWLASEIL